MKIVKLTEEQIKMLAGCKENNQIAQTAFLEASQLIKVRNEQLWKRIKEIFPQYDNVLEYKCKQQELVISELPKENSDE